MTGDPHGRTAGKATLLVRAVDEILGTHKVSGEKSGATLRRRRGKFAYRTTLPSDADAEKIDAQLADDILTVRLPKRTEAQSRKIKS